MKLDPFSEKSLNKKAEKFRKNAIFLKIFTNLKAFVFTQLPLKRNLEKKSRNFRMKILKGFFMDFLKKNVDFSRFLKEKAVKNDKKRVFRMELKAFILWKNEFPREISKENHMKYLEKSFFMKKMLRRWAFKLENKRKMEKNMIKSEVIYRILLQKRVFQRILAFKEKNQREKQVKNVLFMRKNEEIVRNSLKKWVFSAKIRRNRRIIENERYLSSLKEVFNVFKRNFIAKKTRKLHKIALERFLYMKAKDSMDLCFRNWKITILKKKRRQNVRNFRIFANF